MVIKCYLQQVSTELIWRLYQAALLAKGYRVHLARTETILEEVYRIRGEVYASQGYLSSSVGTQGFRDDIDSISVSWLLQWHGQAVGTVRVTPLKFGRSTIFRYLEGVEEILGERKETSVEVGRLGLLEGHRGGFLAVALLLVAYKWSLEHGYQYLVWGGGSWLYRWLRRMVPDTEMKEAGVTESGLSELGGYFHKYVPRVYIVPVCSVRLKEVGRHLVNRLFEGRD